MTTQQSYSLNATRAIEKLAKTMKAIMKDESIQAYLREAPESLTEGKDLYQIAMEDARAAFEMIFKGSSDQEIPYEIYESILRHTDSDKYKEICAIQNTKTRKEAVYSIFQSRAQQSHAAQYLYKNAFNGDNSFSNPRYMVILADKLDLESFEALGQNYINMLADMTNASMNDNLHKVFAKNADLQGHVQAMVDELYEIETAPQAEAEGDEDFEGEYDALHTEDAANYQNGYEEEEDLKSTILDPYTEKLIKLYGKELRPTVDKKHKARQTFAEKNKVDVQDIMFTPVDENLLDVTETLMMTPTHSNVIMVAEKGMDTSGIVTRIAENLYHDQVPQKLLGARVVQLDLEKMVNYLKNTPSAIEDPSVSTAQVAATQLEATLHILFSQIDQHNKSGRPPIYLSIKGFEQAVKPKSILGGKLEEWFTYWLGDEKDVRIIAEISNSGLDAVKSDAPDLYKILNTYKVKEPSEKETITRIKDWLYFGRGKPFSDNYYFSESIIEAAVKLSNKHVNKADEAQPGLTTSIITLAATAAEQRNSEEITLEDVVDAIATRSGKARDIILSNQNERLATLNASIKENLVNQDNAIDSITESFDLIRMGRQQKNKPIGVYLCAGPTGVGKTETAKLIAEHLGAGLVTIDMANYTAEHTIAQILGSPPGYVGFGGKTPLEEIENHDINVVLLDEFEKAHPDIFKAFMAPFDDGRMILRNGKVLNFENTIFLATTNIGEKNKELATRTVGFKETAAEDKSKTAVMDAINDRFPPEFKNRLDDIIIFNDLNKDAVRVIAEIKLNKLAKRFAEDKQHGAFEISEKAMEQLLEIGFVKGMGARPLERAIKKKIDLPLGRWCLDNQDKDPMDYKFTVEEITPEFKVTTTALNETAPAVSNDNAKTVQAKVQPPKLG
ncbi:MAG: hypothetical protein CL561_10915 [Alphaproteobacteria bacterium]|nr:hypothetical protein [Alphaproteobacteria bacterium]|tara:strand:+ start:211818 stop:214517 length:2700 start_codon:yes stop_codon:yes gene_type:complete